MKHYLLRWVGRVIVVFAGITSLVVTVQGQVNSGSNGSDGAFNPTVNTIIDMADHPDGIYHYTSVNVPAGVTVTFTKNATNTPVVWLVQGDCVIAGTLNLNGSNGVQGGAGGLSGPGGYNGGRSGAAGATPGDGIGPGGGSGVTTETTAGGNASYATIGERGGGTGGTISAPGEMYGNQYIVPFIGGSGGGGSQEDEGSGGGGAILIAASGEIELTGGISARGGYTDHLNRGGGGGSGGAIRLVATKLLGNGSCNARGGWNKYYSNPRYYTKNAGTGRIRFDSMQDELSGNMSGSVTHGFQPIIIPPPSQAVSLAIQTVGGVSAKASPTASPVNPDVVVPANVNGLVTIVVKCVNIPLNSEIIVEAKPASGASVKSAGLNNSGTASLSYATVQLAMPRGAGTLQAKAISGIVNELAVNGAPQDGAMLAQTGWLATGERFKSIEITSALGGRQSLTYISESGKRYPMGAQ